MTDAELIKAAIDPIGVGAVLRAKGLQLEERVVGALCVLPKTDALKAIARLAGQQRERGKERSATALTWAASRLARFWHPTAGQTYENGRVGQDGPRAGELVGEARRALGIAEVTVERKKAHVRAAMGKPNREHRCHAYRCEASLPPAMFMCQPHWKLVPTELKARVWQHYQIDQENGEAPVSEEYLQVANEAIAAVRAAEGL